MTDYTHRRTIDAPAERVFDALATLQGLRGWWTPLVSGSVAPSDVLRFELEGLDEYIGSIARLAETVRGMPDRAAAPRRR